MPQNSVAYAVARTRVLEAKLISTERLRRLLDAPDVGSVLRALTEAGYGGQQETDYETIISEELEKACAYVKDITPNVSATNIFFYKYDCHNAKTILKGKLLRRNVSDSLVDTGTIPKAKLQDALSSQQYSALPKNMADAARKVDQSIEAGTADPLEMDCLLDSGCYADMAEAAKASGEPLAVDIVSAQADLLNLKTLLRMRKVQAQPAIVQMAMVPGGSIPASQFVDALNLSEETILRSLGMGKYGAEIAEGMEEYTRTGNLGKLEKNADDYITRMIASHKYEAFTLAPIFGYMLAKEREAQAVRLVIVSKLNDVPADLVMERLRALYE